MKLPYIKFFELVFDSLLACFLFNIVSETSTFPFIWGLFLFIPIVCETFPVSLWFLSCSVLFPWAYCVKSCGRVPVKFSGTVSLISWSYWSCAVVYVDSVCLCFLFLFETFFGWTFPPAGYLKVSLSPTSCFLLCRCGQVVLELVLLYVQSFETFLLVLFCGLFLVILSLFRCLSR